MSPVPSVRASAGNVCGALVRIVEIRYRPELLLHPFSQLWGVGPDDSSHLSLSPGSAFTEGSWISPTPPKSSLYAMIDHWSEDTDLAPFPLGIELTQAPVAMHCSPLLPSAQSCFLHTPVNCPSLRSLSTEPHL
jgi:hypothetical protein